MTSVRTSNDVEGWHNRLNTCVNTRGPVAFYLLIQELFRESKTTATGDGERGQVAALPAKDHNPGPDKDIPVLATIQGGCIVNQWFAKELCRASLNYEHDVMMNIVKNKTLYMMCSYAIIVLY